MATATAMYHSGKNPLRKITRDAEPVDIVRGDKRRRLHKAFLRYHDANNWPLLREALKTMGRADLIDNGKHHLIPTFQPLTDGGPVGARKKNSSVVGVMTKGRTGSGVIAPVSSPVSPTRVMPKPGLMLSQHTGLPLRPGVTGKKPANPVRNVRG